MNTAKLSLAKNGDLVMKKQANKRSALTTLILLTTFVNTGIVRAQGDKKQLTGIDNPLQNAFANPLWVESNNPNASSTIHKVLSIPVTSPVHIN